MAGLVTAIEAMGLGGPDVNEDALWDFHNRDAIATAPQGPGRRAARAEGRGELRGVVADRAPRPPAHHRLHLGRAPDRDRRDAPGHRPARLRPGRPAQRLQEGGVRLYEEMRGLIRHQVATTIFRVSIVRQPAPPPGVEGTGRRWQVAVRQLQGPAARAIGGGTRQRIASGMSPSQAASPGPPRRRILGNARAAPRAAPSDPATRRRASEWAATTMLVRVRQEVQEVPRELTPGQRRRSPVRRRRPTTRSKPRSGAAATSRTRAGRDGPDSPGERLRDLLLVALAFALGACALTAYTTFRIWQVGQQDGRRHVDAIVVLGAAQYNGRPSGALAARLDHAIELYKEGDAPYLITTGGNLPGDNYTEAQTGFNYAIARGVPASAILMENTGHTTLESIQHVGPSSTPTAAHGPLRLGPEPHAACLRLAQDQGIEAWASPTTTSPDDIDGPHLQVDGPRAGRAWGSTSSSTRTRIRAPGPQTVAAPPGRQPPLAVGGTDLTYARRRRPPSRAPTPRRPTSA
jgi:hypothetical protein